MERIKSGKSKVAVEQIRKELDKDRANKLKANLPAICFSGKFTARNDAALIEHSGYIVLDFDNVDLTPFLSDLRQDKYVYACWVSPSGNGAKCLVKIANKDKHREHFQALQEHFKEVDKSGINISRVCYESYDPDLYINNDALIFNKLKFIEQKLVTDRKTDSETFAHILKWLSNRGDAFVSGERNRFIFLLASACCRFGMSEIDCINECYKQFQYTNDFTQHESERTIKAGYKSNQSQFGSASFEKEELIDTITRKTLEIDASVYDENIKTKDIIFGEDVKANAIDIYNNGYESLKEIGVIEVDERWKAKKGELTLLSGIGNYGKSTFLKWYLLMRAIMYGEKWGLFAPEDNPAHEFYHECTEILLGAECTPYNNNRPTAAAFEEAYDFVSNHFFFIHPKDKTPTPQYVKERFLELSIKQGITGCIVDPFNQMTNNYGEQGGRTDKYLEVILSSFTKFAQLNNLFFIVVAHPHKLMKDATGNYPCPDVFDLADGAMWNNKCDNILMYHRPNHQKEPTSNVCEFHSKKIRRQRTVGKKGFSTFEFNYSRRRYIFEGIDPMTTVLRQEPEQVVVKERPVMWYDILDKEISLDEFEGF